MKKKEVELPFNLESSLLKSLLQSRPGVILSNWSAQGMRYMNRYEMLYRVVSEIFVITLLSLILALALNKFAAVLISFMIVHTFFWLFNGHFYVLMRYVSNRENQPSEFLSYVERIYERVANKTFLLAVVAFGSLSKGEFSATSDFDLRLFRRKGFFNSVRAFTLCALERARAFLNAFPLDIYVFDLDEIRHKIRPDEPPIVMFDPDGVVANRYKSNKVEFNEFREKFCESFVNR